MSRSAIDVLLFYDADWRARQYAKMFKTEKKLRLMAAARLYLFYCLCARTRVSIASSEKKAARKRVSD